LVHVRGGQSAEVEHEYNESMYFTTTGLYTLDGSPPTVAVLESTQHMHKSNPLESFTILAGLAKGNRHLARRAWIAVGLQIMAQWTGITAVTVYSSVLFGQAGYNSITVDGLSGGESIFSASSHVICLTHSLFPGVNSIGLIGTVISALILDRIGRRKVCNLWASVSSAMILKTTAHVAGSHNRRFMPCGRKRHRRRFVRSKSPEPFQSRKYRAWRRLDAFL
jgi:hypothetical protein